MMNKNWLLGCGLMIGLALAGPVLAAANADSANEAIAAAEAARKKAASVGGEWRDTGSMLKDAKAAVEAGEFDKAVKLAEEARGEGELGYAQMMAQQELKMPSYLKY